MVVATRVRNFAFRSQRTEGANQKLKNKNLKTNRTRFSSEPEPAIGTPGTTIKKKRLTVIAVRALRPPFLLRLLVGSGLGLGLPLQLLHLCPLILEPDLNHAHAEAGILGEGFSHFSAGLRRHLERRLELTSLCRRENRSRPFRTPTAVPRSIFIQ